MTMRSSSVSSVFSSSGSCQSNLTRPAFDAIERAAICGSAALRAYAASARRPMGRTARETLIFAIHLMRVLAAALIGGLVRKRAAPQMLSGLQRPRSNV